MLTSIASRKRKRVIIQSWLSICSSDVFGVVCGFLTKSEYRGSMISASIQFSFYDYDRVCVPRYPHGELITLFTGSNLIQSRVVYREGSIMTSTHWHPPITEWTNTITSGPMRRDVVCTKSGDGWIEHRKEYYDTGRLYREDLFRNYVEDGKRGHLIGNCLQWHTNGHLSVNLEFNDDGTSIGEWCCFGYNDNVLWKRFHGPGGTVHKSTV